MGNTLKNKKKRTLIKEEWNRKKNHRILLFIGNNEMVTAKCIHHLVKHCNESKQTNENISFSYNLNGFIVNEESNGCDSSSFYQHLDMACKNRKIEDEKCLHYDQSFKTMQGAITDKVLLTYAYIRSRVKINYIYPPMDIIQIISEYVRLPSVDSFLLEMNGKTYELWNLYHDDTKIWSQLFEYADGIILNVDLCDYQNEQQTLNLFKYVSGIFQDDNNKEHYIPENAYILILDNVTAFKNKINTGSFSSIEEYNESSNFQQQIRRITENFNEVFSKMSDPHKQHFLYTHLADQERYRNRNIYKLIFGDITHIIEPKYFHMKFEPP